jgi:hypothetical protein
MGAIDAGRIRRLGFTGVTVSTDAVFNFGFTFFLPTSTFAFFGTAVLVDLDEDPSEGNASDPSEGKVSDPSEGKASA